MASYEAAVEGGHTLDLPTSLAAGMPGSQQQQLHPTTATAQDGYQVQQSPHMQQQDDYFTASLKQTIITDMEKFFQAEVASRSAAISEDVANLQYEAYQLGVKAASEKATVLGELERLHKLVASFQAQIRELAKELLQQLRRGYIFMLRALYLASSRTSGCTHWKQQEQQH